MDSPTNFSCQYCEKNFTNKQNKKRHEKICTQRENTPQENILTQQIEFYKEQLKQQEEQYKEQLKQKDEQYKEQLKQKDEQLKQKDDLIKELIEKVSAPSCQVIQTTPVKMKQIYDLSMNFTTQNKVVEEQQPEVVYKNKYDKWVFVDCKDALSLVDFLERIDKAITDEVYDIIAMKSYYHKYLYILKEGFKDLEKNQFPIQIKQNGNGKEEGYIKIDDKFEKFYRTDLFEKITKFIKSKMMNMLNSKQTRYMSSEEYNKLDNEDQTYTTASIHGFEDLDPTGKDTREKKIITLVKYMIDFCMIPV
jgi:hypothetical protein